MNASSRSRRSSVLALAVTVACVAGATGQTQVIFPVAQDRSVFGSAHASDDFYYRSAEETDAAPDFGPFYSSVIALAEVQGATGSGVAVLDSSIYFNSISATGNVSAAANGWDFNGWARGEGLTIFELSFDVPIAARARVVGIVDALQTGYCQVLLADSLGAVWGEFAFGPAEQHVFDVVLDLPPESYRIMAFADSLTHGNMFNSESGFAGFEMTFDACSASDIDSDGEVGLGDAAILLANYGGSGGMGDGDLDGDGEVGLGDLSILLADYGTACTFD